MDRSTEEPGSELERAQQRIEKLVEFARLQKEQIVKLVAERNRYRELYFRAMAEKDGTA